MRALIIDDEEKAISLLTTVLEEYCPEVTEVFGATDLVSGVAMIKKDDPDIVFLDIEMPEHSGLEILDFFNGEIPPVHIIFVTAYNQYAIQAFKVSAIDYVLKPINVMELQKAVKKCAALDKDKNVDRKLNDLKKLTVNTLALEVPNGFVFHSYDDIQYFEADGSYTKVYLKSGAVELICKPLKHFVDQLNDNPYFYKSNRSYLVNLTYVKRFSKLDGGYLLMRNDVTLPIAKSKKEEFAQTIQNLF